MTWPSIALLRLEILKLSFCRISKVVRQHVQRAHFLAKHALASFVPYSDTAIAERPTGPHNQLTEARTHRRRNQETHELVGLMFSDLFLSNEPVFVQDQN